MVPDLKEDTVLIKSADKQRSRFQYLFTVFELCAGLGTEFCLWARNSG